jgi:predicted phage terminase large subunit-like protein
MSVGVGSPPTGRGGNLIVIDDPIKTQAEAFSKAFRDKLWRWWQFDLRTRIEPNGIVVIIMSRWHEDDLVGRLLAAEERGELDDGTEAERWDVLHLPALADPAIVDPDPLGRRPGEALCPERYDQRALLRLRDNPATGVGPRAFSALYQGRPTPAEGTMFRREDWRYTDVPPAGMRWVRAWDLAGSTDGDWTVGVKMARDDRGFTYIGDVVRFREEPAETERRIRLIATEDVRTGCRRQVFPQDPGQAGKSQKGYLSRIVFGGLDTQVHFETMSGSKAVRAEPYSGQQGANNVVLVKAPWNAEFVEEHTYMTPEGTTGTHDDQVDATALGFTDVHSLAKQRVRVYA